MYHPNFKITNNLLTYISKIEAAKSMIDQAPLVPAWEAKFRDDAFNRTIHFGTKIEGNDLTKEQAQQIVRMGENADLSLVNEKAGFTARDRDVQEVLNYRNVIAWIEKQNPGEIKSIFTIDTLKILHKLTVENLIDANYVGAYRDKQVIVKSAVNSEVVYRPPISMEIPYLIEDFFEWIHAPESQEIHPIFKAAITHYQLVFIHPFIEGKVRTARAMATLLLYVLGYDFKKFFSLEQYFDSDVEAYYQALLSVQQSGENDLSYWLEYFCYGLAVEIDKVRIQVTRLSKDLKLKKQLGEQVALSERQIILLELFQQQDSVTSDDMSRVLPNISIDTILRDVKDLIEKNIVHKRGVTKGVQYKLVE